MLTNPFCCYDEAIGASIDAGVSTYIVDGLAAPRIRQLVDLTVRWFNAFARLQADLDEAKGKLAEREAIDRAKRILMNSRSIAEPEAYAEMRKAAMSQNKRIADIAEAVITAHALMSGIAATNIVPNTYRNKTKRAPPRRR